MCAGGAGGVPRRTDHDLARRGRMTGVRRSGSRYTDGRYRSWPMPTRPAGKSHARLPHTFTQTVVRSSSDSPRANLARTSRIGSAPIVRQPSNACRDCYNDTNRTSRTSRRRRTASTIRRTATSLSGSSVAVDVAVATRPGISGVTDIAHRPGSAGPPSTGRGARAEHGPWRGPRRARGRS